MLSLGRADADAGRNEGRADLALGVIRDLPDTILSQTLYQQSYLVAGLPARPPIDVRSFPVSVFRYHRNAHNPMSDRVIQQLIFAAHN